SALLLAACGVAPRELMSVANRVRKMFDLDAVPAEINGVFARDKRFFKLVDFNPGQRLPGGWDPFETAVRAVVGQQISVKAATTVMGKIVELYGEGGLLDDGSSLAEGSLLADGSTRCFPTPDRLAEIVADSLLADGSLPMPSARAATIGRLAQQVRDGQVSFDATQKASDFIASLTAIKGIGPWTAQYIAMRALGDPDVFLPGDLVVKKSAARRLGIATEQKLIARAEAWRPWRAYAVMHLWRTAAKAPRVTVPNKRQGS
ncbi:MAG: DNA-3-methyladenine glycosylase family protein, partial [Pseudomonadales bacterium]